MWAEANAKAHLHLHVQQQVETGAYVPVQEKSSRGYPSSGMSSCPIGEEELRQSV